MVANLTMVTKETIIKAKEVFAMRELTEEQRKRIEEFIEMDDMEFFEKHLADASIEELAVFLEEFPEFLNEESIEIEL